MARYLKLLGLCAISLSLLTSCQKSLNTTELSTNPYLENEPIVLDQGSLDVSYEHLQSKLENIDEGNKLPFAQSLNTQISEKFEVSDSHAKAYVAYQLYKDPKSFPILPGASIALSSFSLYDGNETAFTLRMPKNPSDISPLILFLGEEGDFPKEIKTPNAWQAFIPSREAFNYQIIGEGDFLHTINDIEKTYPHLEHVEKIIVGSGNSSRPALYFANFYPHKFQKVAWSGNEDAFEFNNLDEVPISYFNSELASPYPFTGEKLISRLQDRGNSSAYYASDLNNSLEFLLQAKPSKEKMYSFRDYQHAKVSPWLNILHKISEQDEASLHYEYDHSILNIKATNISHLVLYPKKMPSSWELESVNFNGETWTCSRGMKEMILGPLSTLDQLPKNKTAMPSSFIDFFRNEPVFVVYQDKNAPRNVLEKIKHCADRVAALDFRGFPNHQIRLPLLSLSEYASKKWPKHRIIYWGMEPSFETLLGKGEGFSPINIENGDVYVAGALVHELQDTPKSLAYMLSKSIDDGPMASTPACYFISDELEGFSKLESEWLSSTSLYKDHDFEVWAKNNASYENIASFTFGGFFGNSAPSTFLFHNPFKDKNTWSNILSEYLLSQVPADGVLSYPYFYPIDEVPDEFYIRTMDQFLKNRTFSLLYLNGWEGANLLMELKEQIPEIYRYGLAKLTPNEGANWPSDLQVKIIVDNEVIKKIPEGWLNSFEYTPLPKTLKEIVQKGFQDELPFFQLEMQRIAQDERMEDSHG